MLPAAVYRSSSGVVEMLCSSGFVDNVTFAHNLQERRRRSCSCRAPTQRDLPQGSTGLGAESVDHVCLYEMTAAAIAQPFSNWGPRTKGGPRDDSEK